MVYDYNTDIINLTNMPTLTNSLMTWAVTQAKTFYIADDPANYNDDTSQVDNRLVSILAAGFIALNNAGIFFGSEFTLDELTIKESKDTAEQMKFFKMFFDFLNLYRLRGVLLSYADSPAIMGISPYDPADYVETTTLPEGLEQ